MFGTQASYFGSESIEFTKDLEEVALCLDYHVRNQKHADFAGLQFTEYGEESSDWLISRCSLSKAQRVNLTGKRLLGFRAVVSDYTNSPPYRLDTVNIRQLCPIVHEVSCDESSFFETGYDDMTAYIPGPEVT